MIEWLSTFSVEGVNDLPNIKASILSVKSDAKRRARNVAEKTRVRRAIRSVNDAVAAGNADEAKTLLVAAYKSIDQAAANTSTIRTLQRARSRVLPKRSTRWHSKISKTPFHSEWRFLMSIFRL